MAGGAWPGVTLVDGVAERDATRDRRGQWLNPPPLAQAQHRRVGLGDGDLAVGGAAGRAIGPAAQGAEHGVGEGAVAGGLEGAGPLAGARCGPPGDALAPLGVGGHGEALALDEVGTATGAAGVAGVEDEDGLASAGDGPALELGDGHAACLEGEGIGLGIGAEEDLLPGGGVGRAVACVGEPERVAGADQGGHAVDGVDDLLSVGADTEGPDAVAGDAAGDPEELLHGGGVPGGVGHVGEEEVVLDADDHGGVAGPWHLAGHGLVYAREGPGQTQQPPHLRPPGGGGLSHGAPGRWRRRGGVGGAVVVEGLPH